MRICAGRGGIAATGKESGAFAPGVLYVFTSFMQQLGKNRAFEMHLRRSWRTQRIRSGSNWERIGRSKNRRFEANRRIRNAATGKESGDLEVYYARRLPRACTRSPRAQECVKGLSPRPVEGLAPAREED